MFKTNPWVWKGEQVFKGLTSMPWQFASLRGRKHALPESRRLSLRLPCVRAGICAGVWTLAASLLGQSLLHAQSPPLQRFEYAEPHMGMPIRMILYASGGEAANAAARQAYDEIRAVDQACTDYDDESELMRLCASAPHAQAVPASDILFGCLLQATEFSKASAGAFDVTVGPYVQQWKKSRRTKKLPTPELLQQLKESVGYQSVELDEKSQSLRLMRPGTKITLGGIAAGFAVDRGLAKLKAIGIASAMIDASGDIGVLDPPPGEVGWRIDLSRPGTITSPPEYAVLRNTAITTSGDLTQNVQIDGITYSHIVDPRTGLGVTHRSLVTVIAPNCTQADALATTFSVLGGQNMTQVLKHYPDAQVRVSKPGNEGQVETLETEGFSAYLVQQ